MNISGSFSGSFSGLYLGWFLVVFFGVLLVGFAYVWKRGDLDWIRALTKKSMQAGDQTGVLVRK